MELEPLVKAGTLILARITEVIGALIIGYAVLRAAVAFVLDALHGPWASVPKEAIRLTLGRSLALSLEFLLGADILNTAIAPTWDQVGLLAAIAAIRTGLNYFLQKELDHAAEFERKTGNPEAAADITAARAAPGTPGRPADGRQRGG